MTLPHIFGQIFWYLPVSLQAVLLIAMLVRRLYRVLPYFFAYNLSIVVQVIALRSLAKESHLGADIFFLGQLISFALGLAIIYEVYASLLKEYPVLRKVGIVLFWVTSVVLLAVAAWTAYHTPGADTARLAKGFLTLERSVRIVQGGLLIALFVFASFFGLSWKNQLFGIALGFAVFVCTELAVVAARTYTGPALNSFYRYLNPASWDVALIIWTFYTLKQWRPPDLPKLPKGDLAEWNDTLQELLHR